MDQDVDPGRFRYSNFGLEVSTGRLLTLHGAADDVVDAMKARCRNLEVRCPVENCESPELSATVGYERADGTPVTAYFSHRAGGGDGGHGPESYAAARMKHAVRDWAESLGHRAEVDALVAGSAHRTGVAIDGPASFGVEIGGPAVEVDDWSIRNGELTEANRDPLWLWLSPGGACPTSFRMSWVAGEYEELGDIWFAGINGDGDVQLAMASGFPTFTYEANPEVSTGADDFPGLCRPLWRSLTELELDRDGFVDQVLLDMIAAKVDSEDWYFDHRTQRKEPIRGRPGDLGDGPLFQSTPEVGGVDRSGWSPEELSIAGTRWLRDTLHDRRHQAFLDGRGDLCAYDWGIPD